MKKKESIIIKNESQIVQSIKNSDHNNENNITLKIIIMKII